MRDTYSVRLQARVIDTLRHSAVDEHRPLSELLEEAIGDLPGRYGRALPGKDEGRGKDPRRR